MRASSRENNFQMHQLQQQRSQKVNMSPMPAKTMGILPSSSKQESAGREAAAASQQYIDQYIHDLKFLASQKKKKKNKGSVIPSQGLSGTQDQTQLNSNGNYATQLQSSSKKSKQRADSTQQRKSHPSKNSTHLGPSQIKRQHSKASNGGSKLNHSGMMLGFKSQQVKDSSKSRLESLLKMNLLLSEEDTNTEVALKKYMNSVRNAEDTQVPKQKRTTGHYSSFQVGNGILPFKQASRCQSAKRPAKRATSSAKAEGQSNKSAFLLPGGNDPSFSAKFQCYLDQLLSASKSSSLKQQTSAGKSTKKNKSFNEEGKTKTQSQLQMMQQQQPPYDYETTNLILLQSEPKQPRGIAAAQDTSFSPTNARRPDEFKGQQIDKAALQAFKAHIKDIKKAKPNLALSKGTDSIQQQLQLQNSDHQRLSHNIQQKQALMKPRAQESMSQQLRQPNFYQNMQPQKQHLFAKNFSYIDSKAHTRPQDRQSSVGSQDQRRSLSNSKKQSHLKQQKPTDSTTVQTAAGFAMDRKSGGSTSSALAQSLDHKKFLTNQLNSSNSQNTNTLYSLQYMQQKQNNSINPATMLIQNAHGVPLGVGGTASESLNRGEVLSFNMHELSSSNQPANTYHHNGHLVTCLDIEELHDQVVRRLQLTKKIILDKDEMLGSSSGVPDYMISSPPEENMQIQSEDEDDDVEVYYTNSGKKRSKCKSRCSKRKQSQQSAQQQQKQHQVSMNVVAHSGDEVIGHDI